jgi:proline racemase
VTFRNVPCFVIALDRTIEVPGHGAVEVDVAYGGMMYALVDAASLGFTLDPSEARMLVDVGEHIKLAAARQIPAVHPENPAIHTINQVLFAGPCTRLEDGRWSARNTVVVSPGRLDRSPCGTGTSARLAVMHARGQIARGEELVHESIIGTKFTARVEDTVTIGGRSGIVPSVTGRAWLTAFHQYVLDPDDPFPTGYRLGDTWPDSLSEP